MKLQRHPSPVLLPDPTSDWECYNVFNPAVVYHNGLWHMWYRAQGLDWVSRIGYAVSADGLHWNRLRRPVLEPHDGTDSRGVEDPRVVVMDGVFYMTYTAYGREYHGPGK
ncbi:MAG: glycosidase, partial [Caldilineales bacterium]|nr:glycosidase [Caldilineales bacterium]